MAPGETKRYTSVICRWDTGASAANRPASRSDTSSAQKTWWPLAQNVRRRSTIRAGDSAVGEYLRFERMRTTPFSVSGQVAHPSPRLSANQSCAASWWT